MVQPHSTSLYCVLALCTNTIADKFNLWFHSLMFFDWIHWPNANETWIEKCTVRFRFNRFTGQMRMTNKGLLIRQAKWLFMPTVLFSLICGLVWFAELSFETIARNSLICPAIYMSGMKAVVVSLREIILWDRNTHKRGDRQKSFV